jgi:DNA-directed RNA polymerase specialized sigma24 family protein
MAHDDVNSSASDTETPASAFSEFDPIRAERHRFDQDFLELQDSRSSSGRVMYVFVRSRLRSFGLANAYKEAYILNEAYIRGTRLIDQGNVIHNPTAWLRQTAYNIIRELRRDQKKLAPLEETSLPEVADTVSEQLEDDLNTLRMAFQMLTAKDQTLLNLKIVDGLSWRQVRETLKASGYGDCAEAVLRKRKERALTRLRKKFHALKPPDGYPESQPGQG